MEKRKLGTQGLEVPAMGLGCMGMSFAYNVNADEDESIRTLERSLELGINLWDTAELYGPFANEELLGRVLKTKRREDVIIATKFAWRFDENGNRTVLDGSAKHVKETVEGSLRRLGTDYIDLYYQHRVDPNVPIEETVGAMGELVKEGKVRYLGLSEAGPTAIRKAHATHPISAVQTEYSLWERGVEEAVLPTVRELGIGFVAYSPLGRGFLSGRFKKESDIPEGDWRRNQPRFQGENFAHNLRIVGIVEDIAKRAGATAAQVALKWVLKQGEDIVPIPGTKHVQYLEENAAALDVAVPEDDWQKLDEALGAFTTAGTRYPKEVMQFLDTK